MSLSHFTTSMIFVIVLVCACIMYVGLGKGRGRGCFCVLFYFPFLHVRQAELAESINIVFPAALLPCK